MPSRYIHKAYQIDTNMINARQTLPSMNKLEKWGDDEVIRIDMSEIALNEASAGKNSVRTKKAQSHIYSLTKSTTPQEQDMMSRIERIIFSAGADNANQKNDVEVIFNAWKYGRTLVSNDGGSKKQPGGILGNATKLWKIGIKVLRDSEAVKEVEAAIEKRDRMAQLVFESTGEPLPAWVGND